MRKKIDSAVRLKLRSKRKENPLAVYEYRLKDTELVRKSTIRVERIGGPILLISGKDDKLWPSDDMARQIMARLKEKKHKFPFRHLSYDKCDHSIHPPLQPPSLGGKHPVHGRTMVLGGSLEANSYAGWDSWPKVLAFLRESLK